MKKNLSKGWLERIKMSFHDYEIKKKIASMEITDRTFSSKHECTSAGSSKTKIDPNCWGSSIRTMTELCPFLQERIKLKHV